MIVTKADAKTMWCPMSRVVASVSDSPSAPAHTGYNRVFIEEFGSENYSDPTAKNPKISRCIADQCMMWRDGSAGPGIQGGYCGLAGHPLK